MIEQLIAEATKFDFKVALKTNPPVKKHPIAFPTRLVIVAGRQNACFYTP